MAGALAAIVVNLAFLGYRYFSSSTSVPGFSDGVPKWGDDLPEWSGQTLSGELIEGRKLFAKYYGVLMYSEREPSADLVCYLQILHDRYAEHGSGLRVALVVGPDHASRAKVVAATRVTDYPVIHDADGRLARALRMKPHMDHSFLAGPDSRLLISVEELLDRDELRQHVEKHLLGMIHYTASVASLLGPEAELPGYEVVEIDAERDGAEPRRYSPAVGATVVVLPAVLCSSCDQRDLYRQIGALQAGVCRDRVADCALEVLVTAGYPVAKLQEGLADLGVGGFRVFHAVGHLSGLEDEYFTKRRVGMSSGALVLRVGADRRVATVETLAAATEALDA